MNPADADGDETLPRWWTSAFTLALVVAAGYWLWQQAFFLSPRPLDRYAAGRAAAIATSFVVAEADLAVLASDALAVRAGGQLFATRCVSCHGVLAEGRIGPNLTDDYWIGGSTASAIYTTIVEGRARKGMQAWGSQLGPAGCKQLTAFVLSLRGHPRPGKPPEGDRAASPAAPPAASPRPVR